MNIKPVISKISEYRNLLILNAALLVFLLVMLWIKPIDGLRKYDIYDHAGDAEETILPIYGDKEASQSFVCHETVDSFEIYASPVNDEYHGVFSVKLKDDNDNVIKEWITQKLDTADEWVQYRCGNKIIEPGRKYSLVISAPELDEFGAIGISVFDIADETSPEGGFVYRSGGDNEDGYANMVMGFGVYRHMHNVFAFLALLCLFAAVNICYVFRNAGVERLALPILIAAGLIMLFILAPGSGPDDKYHYHSSIKLSNILMGHKDVTEIETEYRSYLPTHRNTNSALVQTYEGLRYRTGRNEGTLIYEGRMDKLKWPLSHLAQALGLTIGRIFKLGFIRVYTLGRLFNMAAYIALALLAVKLVPINKELMLMMAILPLSMQQATQLSYDAPVNGIALVFTAFILKLLNEDRQFGWKDSVICLVLLVAISPLKVIYFLLVFLLLLIPGARFRSRIDRIIKLALPVVCAAISLFATRGSDVRRNVVRNTAGSVTDTGLPKLMNYSIKFVLAYPVRFVKLIVSNGESHLSDLFKGMIGGSLAGFTVGIPEQLVMIFALCLFLCAIAEKRTVLSSAWQTVLIGFVVLLGYCAMLTVFAFAETKYGFTYIGGTQGRYLIPFMFPALYCLCGRKLSVEINRKILFIPIAFVEIGYIVQVMSSIDF